ncbi:MAG: L-rhamnose isomerase [Actinobacteria bacterium]|nr:L-rhamnose isomerase [Actinomycetota bacterium]
MKNIEKQYEYAKEYYAGLGINTDKVLKKLEKIPVSIHCWQGDDVVGFEESGSALGGGILATGNFKGRARNLAELQQDIEKAFSLIPGAKKINLHPIYGDFKGKKVDRNAITVDHFKSWADWAESNSAGIDFNPTPFSHIFAESGYTLSSKDKKIRDFWIEHTKRCREISNYFGKRLKKTCIFNLWIQDGSKDITLSKLEHRQILKDSLDEVFSIKYPESNIIDSLESKLFGIASESYVVGSHEFYLSYAVKNDKLITFDTGHFHPTELVSDKISAVLPYIKGIMLHLSRGIRWDSDHVTILSDEVINIMREIVISNALDKVYIGTDFFDASINRIGAWVIGARAVIKALLFALLEPVSLIKKYESSGQLFARLGLLEDTKTMPFGAVWNYYCSSQDMPQDLSWIDEVFKYEKDVLDARI